MSANLAPPELQSSLDEFIRYRREHLTGDEKGEAQIFLDRFFKSFGHGGVREAGATLEERVPRRSQGGTAFADLVWKPRVLIEMKKAGSDLSRHFRQAFEYWLYLVPDRPKYVILCNFDEFHIYDFNKQLEEPIDRVAIDELSRHWEVFSFLLPEEEEPVFRFDLEGVTRESAARVAAVFNALVDRGIEREAAQRFILQAVMAMFSEDIGLLPRHTFARAIEDSYAGGSSYDLIFGLFQQMNAPGVTPAGRYAGTPYFNGGLFRVIEPYELTPEELKLLSHASQSDWSQVKPVIFGTLFEQSLGKDERHALGAHFTSEADIQRVVIPCIVRPWRERIESADSIKELGALETALHSYRVLDPACGSGNFLYTAYRELRRLERDISDKRSMLQDRGSRKRTRRQAGVGQRQLGFVSATQFFGMDIRPFAVEVAKVTLMLARKLAADELDDELVVLPLDDLDDNFIADDALKVDWPAFDVCIGNPPYLGRRRIVQERGAMYADWLRQAFPEVQGVSDYVVYFFRKAHDLLPSGERAGLVGTNTVRQGDTRRASLDYITSKGGTIFEAVSSKPWSGDAVVHVSIVNWIKDADVSPKFLWLADGEMQLEVPEITGSLSPSIDAAAAVSLRANKLPKKCFQGQTPGHTEGFTLTPEAASEMVSSDSSSAAVIHPFLTGEELNAEGLPSRFVIDIAADDALAASQSHAAFDHVKRYVLPVRKARAEEERGRNVEVLSANPTARINRHHQNFLERWWQLSYRRPDMVEAIRQLDRYIALSRVAIIGRPSIYAFVSPDVRPGDAVQVFAFSDDYSLGILQCDFHRQWFEARCSTMRRDLRYTSKTVFDSFPWPQNPSSDAVERVVTATKRILDYRHEQLSSGITLGDQYDSLRSPGRSILRRLHEELDAAVADAYGFDPEDDVVTQLLALNASCAKTEDVLGGQVRGPGGDGLDAVRVTDYMIHADL